MKEGYSEGKWVEGKSQEHHYRRHLRCKHFIGTERQKYKYFKMKI